MQHHLLTNWPDTGYGRGGRRALSSKVSLAAREVLQLVHLLHNSSCVIFNLRRVIDMDGPPADIWYSPHAQTRCFVTSEATNFGKVLWFQHLTRTPVRAFTVVCRRFLGRKIKTPKNKKSSFLGPKTKFGRPLIYNNIPIFAKFGTMTHNGPPNWSDSLKFLTFKNPRWRMAAFWKMESRP